MTSPEHQIRLEVLHAGLTGNGLNEVQAAIAAAAPRLLHRAASIGGRYINGGIRSSELGSGRQRGYRDRSIV